jgi:hypothetical protein
MITMLENKAVIKGKYSSLPEIMDQSDGSLSSMTSPNKTAPS